MEKLLPEYLKDYWQTVVRHEHTAEDYTREYDRALADYRHTWERALILPEHQDLRDSLLAELGRYTQCADDAEVQRRCEQAVASLRHEWESTVESADPQSIERFYDKSQAMLHELMWWHTLGKTSLHWPMSWHCALPSNMAAGVTLILAPAWGPVVSCSRATGFKPAWRTSALLVGL